MVVIVKNKSEVPYGILNNGYIDLLDINNEEWNSVIDYVTGDFTKINEPYDINLNRMWDYYEKQQINKALQIAIDAKAVSDPNFEGLLLSAETRPILYVSEDSYLGADLYTKSGENIYGKWLTNYKNMLMENNSNVYYDVYVFDRLLKIALNYEPLNGYLEMARDGMGIRKLSQILSDKYGKMIDIPSREIIEETRAFVKRPFSYKAEEIILNVAKSKIRSVRHNNLKSFQNHIFVKFVRNVITKYNLNYDPVKFIQKMESSERTYSIDMVYDAYIKKILKGEIQKEKPSMYIPSLEEIEDVESWEVKNYKDPLPYGNLYAMVDGRTSKLSLKDDRVLIQINGLSFPSISHYMIYSVGKLIKGFEPYNMIFNNENKTFYRLDESRSYLQDNINKFKTHYFNERLLTGINSRIKQQPYILDFIKSIGDGNYWAITNDVNTKLTSDTYNNVKDNTRWDTVMNYKGSVYDVIDSDDFFTFIQKEMLESFINILTIATPGDFTHANVIKVYNQFYENIPGTIDNETIDDKLDTTNLQQMIKIMGIKLSEQSLYFLKENFVSRILIAEELAKKMFKNTQVVYMTKFLIIESRYRIFSGVILSPHATINGPYYSKEYTSMVKIISAIANCNDFKVLKEDHIDRAFAILNGNPNSIMINNKPIESLTGIDVSKIRNGLKENKMQASAEEIYELNADEQVEDRDEIDDDDEDQEKEIEGYGEDNDEDYDDLMYGPDTKYYDKYEMERTSLIENYHPTKEMLKYLEKKVIELYNSQNKNMYRIHLWL